MFKKIIYLLFIISINSYGQRLAHTLYATIPLNADNNDVVVELNINRNWDTLTAINWVIVNDTSEIFGLSSDTLVIADNTNLVADTYAVILSVEDNRFYDYCYMYVTVVDTTSNSEFIDLDAEAGGDGTRDNPYNTSERVDQAYAQEGFYYWFKRGTSEEVATDSIDPLVEDITICAYGRGVRPIISGDGSFQATFYFYSISGVTMRDIHVKKSTNGYCLWQQYDDTATYDNCIFEGVFGGEPSGNIRFYSFTNVEIRNCEMINATGDNAYLGWSGDILVNSCFFDRSNIGDGDGDCMQMYGDDGMSNFEISNCWCDHSDYHNKHGFQIGDDSSLKSYHGVVRDNHIIGWLSDMKGITIHNMDSVWISGNVIKGVMRAIDFEFNVNYIRIWNNLMDSMNTNGIYLGTGSYSNTEISNNTIFDWGYGSAAWEGAVMGGNHDLTLKNNIFNSHGHSSVLFYNLGAGSTEDYNISDIWGGWTPGGNSLTGYAQFVDSAASDFRLSVTSPVADAGVDIGLTRDINNYIIPQGTAPDMGAYERIVDKVLKFPSGRDM